MCLPDGCLSLAGRALQVNASDMTNWKARGIINRFGISKLAHAWGHQPPTTLTLHNYPDFLTKIVMPGVSLSKGTLHNCIWEKDSTTGHGGTTVWCLGQHASQSACMADIALLWLPQWTSCFGKLYWHCTQVSQDIAVSQVNSCQVTWPWAPIGARGAEYRM